MEKRVTVRLSSSDFAALQQEAGDAGTVAEALRAGWRRGREAADLAAMEARLADRLAALPSQIIAALAAARRPGQG